MSHPPPYRLLLVDDLPAVREALRWALEDDGDFTVVGEAGNAMEALAQVKAHNPDVVIMDVEMPDLEGPEVARLLKRTSTAAIIFLTMYHDAALAARCAAAGGEGFAEKSAGWGALMAEVRRVLAAREAARG